MWVMGGLLGRVAGQHVIDEGQQTLEALWCQLEHMFDRLGSRSDGTGVLHEILHGKRPAGMGPAGKTPGDLPLFAHSDEDTSSLARTRSITLSVNSVVPAWPPRSGVLMPTPTVSSAAP